jgi:hypothetical protein
MKCVIYRLEKIFPIMLEFYLLLRERRRKAQPKHTSSIVYQDKQEICLS